MVKREKLSPTIKLQKNIERIETVCKLQDMKALTECTKCQKAVLEERVVDAKTLGIAESDEEIARVVVYKVSCTNNMIDSYVDEKSIAYACKQGVPSETGSCKSCRYGKQVLASREIPNKIKQNGKNAKGLTIKRMFYRCRNVHRMKQFDSGTVMATYMSCGFYEEKGAQNAKNRQP